MEGEIDRIPLTVFSSKSANLFARDRVGGAMILCCGVIKKKENLQNLRADEEQKSGG